MEFGGSQPLCLHLHTPDSVHYPGPCWYTVCADFGASPKRASQRLEPPPAHIIYPVDPGTCGRQESCPFSPSQPCLRTPPTPGSDQPMTAANRTIPNPRFHPHQGTPPRLPTQPRQVHSLVEPYSLQPSLQVAAQHPQRQWPSYRPHPTPPPPISPLTRAHSRHEYSPISPSAVKTPQVPTTHTTSMEKPSIPENSRESPMESIQTSLFQRFGADPSCWLDTGPGSLFPSNPMSTGAVARVPRP